MATRPLEALQKVCSASQDIRHRSCSQRGEAHRGGAGRHSQFVERIVVVDDASSDRTAEVVEQSSTNDSRVVLLREASNLGVGGATLKGFRWSVEQGADILVKMDGDGQMDPANLPRLVEQVAEGRFDYAKGNRFLDTRDLAAMPKVRLFENFLLTFLTKLASGYWHLFDPQNGFVALRADAWRRLPLEGLASGYFFENDMLVRLNIAGCRVTDVSIPARYRGEKSSMRLPRILCSFPLPIVAPLLVPDLSEVRSSNLLTHRAVLRTGDPAFYMGRCLWSGRVDALAPLPGSGHDRHGDAVRVARHRGPAVGSPGHRPGD